MSGQPEGGGGTLSPGFQQGIQANGGVLPDLWMGGGGAPVEEEEDVRPRLWLPEKKKKVTKGYGSTGDYLHGGSTTYTRTTGGATVADDVINWIYDEKKRKKIEEYLLERGYDWETEAEFQGIWKAAVDESASAYESSQHKIKKTPWDILDMHAPDKEKEPDPWEGAVKGERFKQTFTQTDIAELDPAAVTMTLRQTLRELLGREPNQEEIEDFASRAASIAHENPSITKRTVENEWDPDLQQYVEVSSENKTSGGVTGEMIGAAAEEEAIEDDEYALYQGSTNVYNAVVSALASPV